MPVYSYHAAAWGHLASYLTMIVLTVLLGRKYYRIPYDWPLILAFVGLGLLIWWVSTLLPEMGTALKICVHLLLVLLYVAAVFAIFVMKKHRYESKNCQ